MEGRADPRLLRLAALAGLIGPVLLAGAIVVLTVVQYDFMRSLRWDPLTAPTVDWPSGLSLGPYGGWMVAAFVTCGLLLPGFAYGLLRALPDDRASRIGCLLLALAGGAMVALSSPTDPTYGGGPTTVAGITHDAAFVALGLTFWPALLVLARSFRRDPRWSGYAAFTLVVAAVVGPAFALKGLAFYGLLVGVVCWFEVIAARLWRLAAAEGRPRA